MVSDKPIQKQIAQWYREGWQQAYGQRRAEILASAASDTGMSRRTFLAAEYLSEHLEDEPVWVFPVLRNAAESSNPRLGSSIYGAVQQLILAARAYGIGTTLTSLYVGHEDDVRELLGLPEDALTIALLPLGYALRGRWAEPKRQPVEAVVHWGRWGNTRTPSPTTQS